MAILPPTIRYAASQLGWPTQDNAAAYQLLVAYGYKAVELVPMKAFGGWDKATPENARMLRKELNDYGLDIIAMQAIFFGVPDLHIFQEDAKRANLVAHIRRCADLADALGATAIVFGAPKLRDPGEIPKTEALKHAHDFFRITAEHLGRNNKSVLTIEPVAAHHGGAFLMTHAETAALIRAVNHPSIRLQFDLGCWLTYDEPIQDLAGHAGLVGHSHISAPQLGRIESAIAEKAKEIFPMLWQAGYHGATSVEMLDGQLKDTWKDALFEAAPATLFGSSS